MDGKLSGKGVVSVDWEKSPCSTCNESWCCTFLALHKFEADSKEDLTRALKWLEHEDILLGLQDDGIWSVNLNRSCRFLEGQLCSLHGKEEQPWICKRFNPHTCWYKRAFPGTLSNLLLQFNRERLIWLIDKIQYSPTGEIETVPSWETLQQHLAKIPLTKISPEKAKNTPLELPAGPQKTERDRDILRYKRGFPGLELSPDGTSILVMPLFSAPRKQE